MARGRLRTEWDQTALAVAVLAEINRNRSERTTPFTVAEFHPYADDEKPEQGTPLTAEEKQANWTEFQTTILGPPRV